MRAKRRRSAAMVPVIGSVLLAGCAGPVDTTKVTYTRTTMPAVEANANSRTGGGEPTANDEAFTNDKLRIVDPCAVLTDEILSTVGTPAENSRGDLGSCGNYMTDKDGKSLNITVYVGESVSDTGDPDLDIGGLPAFEQATDSSACFVTVLTSTTPNIGIKLQTGGDGDDLCAPAKTVLTAVVDLIREDPPTYELVPGTLVDVDPCTAVDHDQLGAAVGGTLDDEPYNVHWCSFAGENLRLGVWFRTGYDPRRTVSDKVTAIDLGGGVTGYQELVTDTETDTSCRLEWAHRPLPEGEDQAEVVTMYFDRSEPPQGVDPCAPGQAAAKLFIAALPKP